MYGTVVQYINSTDTATHTYMHNYTATSSQAVMGEMSIESIDA